MLRSLYRLLLRLHPPAFRERYAEEMLWIFDETADGLETVRLLGDATVSLIRQRLLREDEDGSCLAAAPMFLIAASTLPAGRVLMSGALCSLLLFGAVGSVIARGGRQAFTAVPHAEAVRATSLNFLALAAPPQQPDAAADEPSSISGRVLDAVTGQPIAGAKVQATGRRMGISAITDAQGRYQLENVPVFASGVIVTPVGASQFAGMRSVSVTAGEDLKSVDFRIYPNASVSGVVTDQNGEPLADIVVSFLRRSYEMGRIRYERTGYFARTNDRGEYRLEPYNAYREIPALLWAQRPLEPLDAMSDAPEDPAMRRQAVESTYFPNGVRPEEGTAIRLRPGEQREDVNIQLRSSQSFCVEAEVDLPPGTQQGRFQVNTARSEFTWSHTGGRFERVAPSRRGSLRICDLARGEYRLMVHTGGDEAPSAMGSVLFAITDEDVRNLQVSARPRTPVFGKTVWAAGPPDKPIDQTIYIDLRRLHYSFGGGIRARPKIPEEFRLEWVVSIGGDVSDPLMDEYRVDIRQMPVGVYVKDVTYGGETVFHKSLHLGSKPADAELEVILAHDGGTLYARVLDEQDELLGDATVVLIPKTAATHMELADTRVVGITNNKGEAAVVSVPPGKYWVLAVDDNFTDNAVETIAALFDARLKGEEINIAPNAKVEMELIARGLHR